MKFSTEYHKALWGRIAKIEIETQELKKIVVLAGKEITEEWIKKKAQVISDWSHTWDFVDRKDFIRSLVEEIRGK